MSQKPLPPALGLAARLIASAILIYAGATKAAGASEEFAVVIGSYHLLPNEMVQSAAAFLPWIELFIGWSLLLGFRLKESALAACALFGSFLFTLASVQLRGIQLPNCGCFGDAIHFTPAQAFLMDSCLTALAFLAFKSAPAALSLDSWADGGYTPAQDGRPR